MVSEIKVISAKSHLSHCLRMGSSRPQSAKKDQHVNVLSRNYYSPGSRLALNTLAGFQNWP